VVSWVKESAKSAKEEKSSIARRRGVSFFFVKGGVLLEFTGGSFEGGGVWKNEVIHQEI